MTIKNRINTLLISLLLAGCSGSGGGGGSSDADTASGVTGINRSGTWTSTGIACVDTNFQVITASGSFANPYHETVKIVGNKMVQTISDADCVFKIEGSINFHSPTKVNVTNIIVTEASGGSCSVTRDMTDNRITPATYTFTYAEGEHLPDLIDLGFVEYDSTLIGILSNYDDGRNGYCFTKYVNY